MNVVDKEDRRVTSHDNAAGSAIATIYARLSTEDQGKGFSIPTQIEACQKLAECEGYTVPEAHVLIDEGLSGTTMERPGLRKLRDLVNTRTIQAVIAYDRTACPATSGINSCWLRNLSELASCC
jgi:DNA invertase Pin-like site-specific DNA recombinase